MVNEKNKYHTATYIDDKEIKRALRGIRKEFRNVFEETLKDEPPIEEIQMRIDFLNKAKRQSKDAGYIKEIKTLIKGLSWLIANRVNRQIDNSSKSWNELYKEEEKLRNKPPSKKSQFDEKRLKDLKRIMTEKSINENSDKSGYKYNEDYQREQGEIDEATAYGYEEIDSVEDFYKEEEKPKKKSRKDVYDNWEY